MTIIFSATNLIVLRDPIGTDLLCTKQNSVFAGFVPSVGRVTSLFGIAIADHMLVVFVSSSPAPTPPTSARNIVVSTPMSGSVGEFVVMVSIAHWKTITGWYGSYRAPRMPVSPTCSVLSVAVPVPPSKMAPVLSKSVITPTRMHMFRYV